MKKSNSSFKSLASAVPDLATQWHPTLNGDLTPSEVTSKSSKKAWWRGGCGHEWESVICSRTQGAGCPYCSGLRPIKGFNDLLTSHPDVAKEWHTTLNYPLTPGDVSHGSEKKSGGWEHAVMNGKQISIVELETSMSGVPTVLVTKFLQV